MAKDEIKQPFEYVFQLPEKARKYVIEAAKRKAEIDKELSSYLAGVADVLIEDPIEAGAQLSISPNGDSIILTYPIKEA
jgi:hypothetical protein